jgi:hypothetical protein
MIPAGIKFQLWYKSSLSLELPSILSLITLQLKAHNHNKIDTKREDNPNRATMVCTLVSNPKIRLVKFVAVFGEICFRGMLVLN